MKKIGLGIAILLFSIVFEISWEGYFAYLTTGIGFLGLLVALWGFFEKID